jgi:hypothetical protein
MTTVNHEIHPLDASFRDPNGFLFQHNGVLYRQVNPEYRSHYDNLMASGLYQSLVDKKLLIAHREVDPASIPGMQARPQAYKILQPDLVPFISYPYEWSFSQLRDAGRLTLSILRRALAAEMILKDASAYNIQFVNGRPMLIDTLSFETYVEGEPWVAYRQFCQHFLAPLALMALTDVRLSQLLRVYVDGIPLDLAARLLPFRTRFSFGLGTHIHLHANAQKKYADVAVSKDAHTQRKMNLQALIGLIDSLDTTLKGLQWRPAGTEWADYYNATNYDDAALEQKRDLVAALIDQVQPKTVWDLGANNGMFSRVASERGIQTVAFDIDPAAVEQNYRTVRKNKEKNLLPLVLDLTNPSPALGWDHRERMSLSERGPADCVLALALIHHLAISNNVPLDRLAQAFAHLGRWLIIEFVPKEDSQVQRLLQTRLDIFSHYNAPDFEAAFSHAFEIVERREIQGSKRTLYLMKRIESV